MAHQIVVTAKKEIVSKARELTMFVPDKDREKFDNAVNAAVKYIRVTSGFSDAADFSTHTFVGANGEKLYALNISGY